MSKNWPMVPLGEVLQLQRRWVTVQPTETYTEIGVRCFGKGIFHKAPVSGSSLGNKRVLEIRPGDLVFNNVFGWEGAVAVAGTAEIGKIGSHRFITYTVDSGRSTAAYLGYFFRSKPGLERLRKVSPGSAGRNRTLNLDQFIVQQVPLPPLEEQRRLVAQIEELAAKVGAAHAIQQSIREDSRRLLLSAYKRITEGVSNHPMCEVAPLVRRPVDIEPAGLYHELGIRSFGKGTFHKPAIAGAALGSKRVYLIQV
jgi:type I restriction enzyme S subunit